MKCQFRYLPSFIEKRLILTVFFMVVGMSLFAQFNSQPVYFQVRKADVGVQGASQQSSSRDTLVVSASNDSVTVSPPIDSLPKDPTFGKFIYATTKRHIYFLDWKFPFFARMNNKELIDKCVGFDSEKEE